MAKCYTDLIPIIVDKLKALTDVGGTIFVDVYSTPEIEPEGYPCAYVLDDAGEGITLDTARNERVWQFKITLYQEAKQKTHEEAVVILRKIVDQVIEMFDQDPTLEVGGDYQCQYVKVVPLVFDYRIKEQPWMFAEFIVAVVDVVNHY